MNPFQEKAKDINKTYKNWKPTETADICYYYTEQRNATGMCKHCIAESCDKSVGHPFRFIRGLMNVCFALVHSCF